MNLNKYSDIMLAALMTILTFAFGMFLGGLVFLFFRDFVLK